MTGIKNKDKIKLVLSGIASIVIAAIILCYVLWSPEVSAGTKKLMWGIGLILFFISITCMSYSKRNTTQRLGLRYDEDYYEKGTYYARAGGYSSKLSSFVRFVQYRRKYNRLIKPLNINNSLDVGCAYGFLVKFLNNKGIDSEGIDISEFAIQKAKQLFPTLNFYLSDAAEWNGKKTYDLITAFETLEHCEKLNAAICNIRKHLKDNGFLLCSLPCIDFVDEKLQRETDPTHINFLTSSEWVNKIEGHGFKLKDRFFVWSSSFGKIRPEFSQYCFLFASIPPVPKGGNVNPFCMETEKCVIATKEPVREPGPSFGL